MRNLSVGDRVVIPSTIACGWCSYCRAGYYAQCDEANPNGKQAEYVRVPYASVGLVKLPDGVSDEQAILLSDIFPTGWFGADIAEVVEPLTSALSAYEEFDRREAGWVKVALEVEAEAVTAGEPATRGAGR